MLILVRHAMPDHGPTKPAREWLLSSDGRVAAGALCAQLPSGARLVSSSEPKAIATLEPAGHVGTDPRFDEITRVEPFGGDFRSQRRQYVNGTDHSQWENRTDVVRRFADGVAEHVALANGDPLVIASHGMAMTLWLTATVHLADPGAFWADLRFPDAHVVDLTAGTCARLGST